MVCEGTQMCRRGEGEAALLWGRSELEAWAVLSPFKMKILKSYNIPPYHPQGELKGQKERLKNHRFGAQLQGP